MKIIFTTLFIIKLFLGEFYGDKSQKSDSYISIFKSVYENVGKNCFAINDNFNFFLIDYTIVGSKYLVYCNKFNQSSRSDKIWSISMPINSKELVFYKNPFTKNIVYIVNGHWLLCLDINSGKVIFKKNFESELLKIKFNVDALGKKNIYILTSNNALYSYTMNENEINENWINIGHLNYISHKFGNSILIRNDKVILAINDVIYIIKDGEDIDEMKINLNNFIKDIDSFTGYTAIFSNNKLSKLVDCGDAKIACITSDIILCVDYNKKSVLWKKLNIGKFTSTSIIYEFNKLFVLKHNILKILNPLNGDLVKSIKLGKGCYEIDFVDGNLFLFNDSKILFLNSEGKVVKKYCFNQKIRYIGNGMFINGKNFISINRKNLS